MISDEAYNALNMFNSLLKQLIAFSVSKSIMLKTSNIRIRACAAINESPLLAIEHVGPYLEKYSDKILARDSAFFLDSDYTDEVGGDDNILQLLMIIKKIYTEKCSISEQGDVNTSIISMLEIYRQYLSLLD
jgi:hypothetical protein